MTSRDHALAMPCPTGPNRTGTKCRCHRIEAVGRLYGIGPDLLRGLIEAKRLPGHAYEKKGRLVWVVDRAAVFDLIQSTRHADNVGA